MTSPNLLYHEESYRIRGAVFEVYRQMGCGFLESVYQECLEREFTLQGIPHEPQKEIRLSYQGTPLTQAFRADFLCFEEIIVELKAAKELAPEHQAQILNYLKATGKKVGLLVNFGAYPKAVVERFVL